ncbi:pyridoxamine 5'-phosphate oxidase family protein [Streptomyces sp. NPDC059262]|uniref:pyridoxamine 5'-phosphate oxidase family protein n=1 Tax=Streptomyces sp. NPDC059262 TaxID=3346797 RepID=UPI00369C505C
MATSMRVLPFLASARHLVADGRVVLRLHKGYGYHQACAGSVVAYGAGDLNNDAPADGHWSVQFVGTCEAVEPAPGELDLFGQAPASPTGSPSTPPICGSSPSSSPCTN